MRWFTFFMIVPWYIGITTAFGAVKPRSTRGGTTPFLSAKAQIILWASVRFALMLFLCIFVKNKKYEN